MRYHRDTDGDYVSEDERVVIRRVVTQEGYNLGRRHAGVSRYKDVVTWAVCVDGQYVGMDDETLRDAKRRAERRLVTPCPS